MGLQTSGLASAPSGQHITDHEAIHGLLETMCGTDVRPGDLMMATDIGPNSGTTARQADYVDIYNQLGLGHSSAGVIAITVDRTLKQVEIEASADITDITVTDLRASKGGRWGKLDIVVKATAAINFAAPSLTLTAGTLPATMAINDYVWLEVAETTI